MKKIIYALILVLLVTFSQSMVSFAVEELFDDPSFEKTREDMPDWPYDENWMIWRKNTLEQGSFIDNTVARTGKNSIKIRHISSTNETYVMHITELNNLSEEKTYMFSGYAKTEELTPKEGSNGGAALIIEYKRGGPSGKKVFVTDISPRIQGTTDWTKLETLFNIKDGKEAGADTIVISAVLKAAKGTVWFDDMSLVVVEGNKPHNTNNTAETQANSKPTEAAHDSVTEVPTESNSEAGSSEDATQDNSQSNSPEAASETSAESSDNAAASENETEAFAPEQESNQITAPESASDINESKDATAASGINWLRTGIIIASALFVICFLAVFILKKKK